MRPLWQLDIWESRRQAKIGARAPGRIQEVGVEEGSRVKKDEVSCGARTCRSRCVVGRDSGECGTSPSSD